MSPRVCWQVTGRFNERFILSLADNPMCIMMDDELNILPLSSHVRSLSAVPPGAEADADGAHGAELRDLRSSLQETQPAGPLLDCCRSLDQVRRAAARAWARKGTPGRVRSSPAWRCTRR